MLGNVKDSILQARMPSIVFIVIFAVNIKSICSLNINRWISDLIPCLSVEFTDMVYKKLRCFANHIFQLNPSYELIKSVNTIFT